MNITFLDSVESFLDQNLNYLRNFLINFDLNVDNFINSQQKLLEHRINVPERMRHHFTFLMFHERDHNSIINNVRPAGVAARRLHGMCKV